MYIYNVLLQYLLTAISGLICLVLLLVQGRDKFINKKIYMATLIFVSNTAFIGLLLCAFYSQEVLFNHYNVKVFFRAADYFSYGMLLFSWLNMLFHMRDNTLNISGCADKNIFTAGKIFAAAGTAVLVLIATLLMDSSYYLTSTSAQNFYSCTEILFAAVSCVLIIICGFKSISKGASSLTQSSIIFISVVLIIYYLYQIRFSYSIGTIETLTWGRESHDVSGWILFILNCGVCYFIYKKDFCHIPSSTDSGIAHTATPAELIDAAGKHYGLTKREREITGLVYDGFSNNDIADYLCISLNTVKSHMRNIFYKLDVSSRIELIHIINNQINN